jgi:hypothetical protein
MISLSILSLLLCTFLMLWHIYKSLVCVYKILCSQHIWRAFKCTQLGTHLDDLYPIMFFICTLLFLNDFYVINISDLKKVTSKINLLAL